MIDNRNSWQEGLRVFTDISGWIVGPMILALIVGKWLDNRYGTKPTWLLVMAAVGFLVTIYGIVKAVRRFSHKINNNQK